MFYKILNRINPELIWQLYARKSKKIINKSFFILSFDCDTEEDIKVALDVHYKLRDIGITPVYAVPGELLKKGQKTYLEIAKTGSEFINHGGREHTYFDKTKNRHASCFFYDQQEFNALKEDILLGHKILEDVLQVTPNGFRTPHFGTFQEPEHLNFLYDLLSKMNYKFSSSTSPLKGYQNGPVYKHKNIFEIPVSGIYSEPLNILDSWAFFEAPDKVKNDEDYINSCKKIVDFANKNPVIINIYGDPSHVYNKKSFFKAMKMINNVCENVNYNQLLDSVNDKIRNI